MRISSALTIIAFTAAAAIAGPALAEGDAAAGEKVFNKCKACHTTEAGKNKVGPSLAGVIGRKPGTVEGFKYSSGMEEFGADHVWDEETLSTYLEAPKKVVKGGKMAFVGLKKPDDREDVIAYLKQFSE
ncbi:MAG: c-type cytochrome [Kiloniellaceae bacterium]|nr:c-type cytochrome [Kiloniellaceae bacterium]